MLETEFVIIVWMVRADGFVKYFSVVHHKVLNVVAMRVNRSANIEAST